MTQSQQDSVEQQLDKLLGTYHTHRIGSHSDDWGDESDNPCFCDLKAKLQQLMVDARKDAVKPFQERLGQWLQPELMQDFVHDDESEIEIRNTAKRYAAWLLELDTLAQLTQSTTGNKGVENV